MGEKVEVEQSGITGSTLKIIAMISMLIDHIGASIIENGVLPKVSSDSVISGNVAALHTYNVWYGVDMVMRFIGRLAFPVFCFLLIEGFLHTRDWKKYTLRLLAFGFISEIPFDLAFHRRFFDFSYQNVFFTLLLGVLVMAGMQYFEKKSELSIALNYSGQAVVVIVGMSAAFLMRTDYGAFGVFVIAGLYFLRKQEAWQTVFGCVAFCWEFTAPLAFIPIRMYSGKRGMDLKYVFYAFYPVHLLILGLLTKFCF